MADLLPRLRPIPMKDRVSMVFLEYGQIDVLDGAFVLVDKNGVRTHIPVGSIACIMLCLLYTSPSPRDQRGSRMPSSA